MWKSLKNWWAKTRGVKALRNASIPPTPPAFREPFGILAEADVDQMLLRCRTDLPPVAGLFWLGEKSRNPHLEVLKLINQSPDHTDWWGLHTRETLQGWMAQLPGHVPNDDLAFGSVFQSPRGLADSLEVVAVSAIYSFLMHPVSHLAIPMAKRMLEAFPVPSFVGAERMPLTEDFLSKNACKNPIGAWIPMFQDDQGHTHDLIDIMVFVFQADRLDDVLDLLKRFAPIRDAEREGYLARQMARFSDILDHDMVQRKGVVVPGVLPNAGMVQSFLLAGVCLPSNTWSERSASEMEARATWRPPLMLLLTALETYHGNRMRSVFADVVKRLMAHGHDVVGKGPQAGPPAAKSLMYFAKIQAHDAVALMLRLGANPDEVVWTTHGSLSVRDFIASMNDERMTHLLSTHQRGATARSILDDIDEEENQSLSPRSHWHGFLAPSRTPLVLA